MRPNVSDMFTVLYIFNAAAEAGTPLVQQQPVVVYAGQSTVLAAPYYQRIKRSGALNAGAESPPPQSRELALEAQFPISTTQMSVGQPRLKIVEGLISPVFILGMDDVSLNWFARAAQGLSEMRARGVVVQADHLHDWQAMQTRAREAGIDLILLDGDSLAAGYNIKTYPVVLMSPAQAGQGNHE